MRLGLITLSPLHLRMRRVLAAHPSVTSVSRTIDPAGFDLVVSDHPGDVTPATEIPQDPLRWLVEALASLVISPEVLAYTPTGTPLSSGTAAHFPTPIGALWAQEQDGMLAAPTDGVLAAVSIKGTNTVGVVEDRDFLTAIASVGPTLALLGDTDAVTAMRSAGLSIAQQSRG